MASIRYRIEQGFEQFAHFIYRNRIKTIIVMLILIAAVVSQIPKITIDTSMEGFLHEDDPALLAYNRFRDQFGRDEVVILAIKPPRIFDRKFFQKLQALHQDLEESQTDHLGEIWAQQLPGLPIEGGDFLYRIKSAAETFERVAKESELATRASIF